MKRYLENVMTVAELREALEDFDGETKVLFAYNYGDYWRTQVAEGVETVDDGVIRWSAYHKSPKVVYSDAEHDEDEAESGDVAAVILNIGG